MSKGEIKKNIHEQFDLSDEISPSAKKESDSYSEEDEILEGIEPGDRLSVDVSMKLPGFVREVVSPVQKEKKSSLEKPIIDGEYQKQLSVAAQDKVIVNEEYRSRIPTYEEASRQPSVVVDQGYLSTPEHHKDKVIIDAGYNEAIRHESPDDYIPELSSDLLEEIYENESTPEEAVATKKFSETVENLSTAFESKKQELQEQKRDILAVDVEKKSPAYRENQEKLKHLDKQEERLRKHHEQELEKAEREFTGRMFELAEPVGVDPDRYAEAVRRFDSARLSIEDDYEGDLKEACQEFSKKYSALMKKEIPDDALVRAQLRDLKHHIDVALPALRQERLQDVEKTFRDTIAPTPFERDLNDVTVSFKKRTQKIESEKARLMAERERLEKFPDIARWYGEQIKALQNEGKALAEHYTASVDKLKKEYAQQKEKMVLMTSEKKVVRETVPAREAASFHLENISAVVDKHVEQPEGEMVEMEADFAGPEEIAAEQELIRVQKKLEEQIFVRNDQEPFAEKKAQALRRFDRELGRIESYYDREIASARSEFFTLYDKKLKKTFNSDEEKMVTEKRIAELRYTLDVRLPYDYKKEISQAEKSYQRDMTVTELDKELLSRTVAFEKRSLQLTEKKKVLKDLLINESGTEGVVILTKAINSIDGQLQALAKKYSQDVETVKKIHESEREILEHMSKIKNPSVKEEQNMSGRQTTKKAA